MSKKDEKTQMPVNAPDTQSDAAKIITGKKDDYGRVIVRLLRKIMQQLDTHSRLLLKEYDLTIPQVMCLYEVFEKSSITVAALAENIHLSPSTLIGIVDRLAEKRMVRRIRDEHDRRSVFVNITAKGHQFVTDTPYLLHNRLRGSFNKLPKPNQLAIADSLNTIIDLLEIKAPQQARQGA